MDQMAGAGPLHVFLTVCPLAQCSTQTVLPTLTFVTLSHWPALHAGMPLSILLLWALERWKAVGGPALYGR